jgi:hypothetical protein
MAFLCKLCNTDRLAIRTNYQNRTPQHRPDDDPRSQGGATDEFGWHADEVVPGSLVFADLRPGQGAHGWHYRR